MSSENLPLEKEVKILYKNHRGETSVRRIIPLSLVFTSTEYHPEEQWLVHAYALDRNDERYFSCQYIKAWFV